MRLKRWPDERGVSYVQMTYTYVDVYSDLIMSETHLKIFIDNYDLFMLHWKVALYVIDNFQPIWVKIFVEEIILFQKNFYSASLTFNIVFDCLK